MNYFQHPEEFWERVRVGKPTECWPCRLKPGTGGYCWVSQARKKTPAHVIAWKLSHHSFQTLRPGEKVLHHCDNPPCCNPAHLFAGTQADNVADCIAKGRKVDSPGELSGKNKLSTSDVLRVLDCYGKGDVSVQELADQYNVTRSCIAHIVKGRSWRCVSNGNGVTSSGNFIPHGSNHSRAKLTEAEVLTIRKLAAGGADHDQLAKAYSVNRPCIDKIVWRKTWKHV